MSWFQHFSNITFFEKVKKGQLKNGNCQLLKWADLTILPFWSNKMTKQSGTSNLHYVAMLMMTSQILKYIDFTKTHKSRYLENETFSLQIKKSLRFVAFNIAVQNLLVRQANSNRCDAWGGVK